jgi:hypothetical protein
MECDEQYTVKILLLDILTLQIHLLMQFQFKMESGNIDAGDICLYGIA